MNMTLYLEMKGKRQVETLHGTEIQFWAKKEKEHSRIHRTLNVTILPETEEFAEPSNKMTQIAALNTVKKDL